MKTIKFADNMPKLHGQKRGTLVLCQGFHNAYTLTNLCKKFLEYDLLKSDGTNYKIPVDNFLLLLFVGEKGILFSTLRRANDVNVEKYLNSVGETFKLEVQND